MIVEISFSIIEISVVYIPNKRSFINNWQLYDNIQFLRLLYYVKKAKALYNALKTIFACQKETLWRDNIKLK